MMFIFDYLLITSCLAAVFFSPLLMAKTDPFTFAFDCNKQSKLCAYDRLPKGRFAWLLDPEGNCRVVASEQFVFTSEGETFAATRLIEKTKCPLASGPNVLYLETDYKDSEYFTAAPVEDQKIKTKLLRLIKSDGLIKKAGSDKEKSGTVVAPSILGTLEKSTPALRQITHTLWNDTYLVSIINPTTNKGILAVIAAEKTTLLTGACGRPGSAQFFRINNNAFIRVKNTWCDSDDGEDTIYRLKDHQFELVHSNDVLPALED